MKQSVQGAINIAQVLNQGAPAPGIERPGAPGTMPKPKPKSYFDKERDKIAADPANTAHKSAVALGKAQARAFLAAVKDPSHPAHAKNINTLRNDFEMNYMAVEQHFINEAVEDQDAHLPEKEDKAYENTVIASYRPQQISTSEQFDMFNNFSTSVANLWNQSGYRKNKDAIVALAEKYGLKKK